MASMIGLVLKLNKNNYCIVNIIFQYKYKTKTESNEPKSDWYKNNNILNRGQVTIKMYLDRWAQILTNKTKMVILFFFINRKKEQLLTSEEKNFLFLGLS